jgi:DNA anti-recombination protein RmuC
MNMKKKSALVALGLGLALSACNTSADRVADAKENVADARKELAEAKDEYVLDMEKFKKETADKIAANNATLADLKVRMAQERSVTREKFTTNIRQLEEKNDALKRKINEYRTDNKTDWNRFKDEFNRDMTELGKALKDLSVENVK